MTQMERHICYYILTSTQLVKDLMVLITEENYPKHEHFTRRDLVPAQIT